ncbi:MAG: DNA recombination protein RmuC [Deltaproteobacteria bacterium]|nr:DNA recombination protein RmuC [Deltaproteobacteria bacterium]
MDVNKKLDLREQTIDDLKEQLSNRKSIESRLQTQMEQERKQAAEKLVLLDEAKSELTNQFRVLAQEILEEKGKSFSEQSRAGLKGLLDPFREQLSEFRQRVDNVYVHEAGQRASLKKEIETLRDLNQQINQEAINLTRALKGDKKAMGTWGELILERVLEQSGLRKGVEYETQGGFRDADGKLLKPDVIVHLPEEKDVVVDAKVSLVAYERYAGAEEGSMQKKALSEHMASVRAHIEGLGRKNYSALKGLRSLDFVLMFMPVEAAFVAAFREDMTLYSYAFERKIIVVTPSTLLATLKTIENIWRYERQNRNAQAIFHKASAIYDKLRLFVESMEKLGKQLDTTQCTYEEAMNRLVRGKGNVISQAGRFSELGVPVKRQLPRTVTEIAETEDIGKTTLPS